MDLNALVRVNKERLSELEKAMNYRFTDLRLLQKALVHSSYAFEQSQAGKNNERLEFIGDAVLDLVVGHLLYQKYGTMREGELTRLRAALVNETHLAIMARQLDLGHHLCLGKGEDASQGRNKSSILSCAFEAVIGAVFEDAGYEAVAEIVSALFMPAIEEKKEEMLIADAKSRLQEKLQEKHNEGPTYRLDKEEGPSHQKMFTISVLFQGEVLGCGEARSKKEAEQRAASAALKLLP
ncbi:ribonuclease III [Desulfopila sp. IMCC35008]|uniref:ribonuclease III n=1 Tax=Desulfopila sp. IMCC35008 TaxID=2653858 RepID=UPI001F118D7B|nr:ribonuclease III [Desulfopila sp. IMCC35008]